MRPIGSSSFIGISVIKNPSHHLRSIVGAIIVIAILVVVAFFVFHHRTSTTPVTLGSSADFPGTLMFQVIGYWSAPSGQRASGITVYTPQSGSIFNNILSYPSATTIPVALTAPLVSPDGSHLLVMNTVANATELADFSLSNQKIDEVFAKGSNGQIFFSPVWSSDGSKIAYVDLPSPLTASAPSPNNPQGLYVVGLSGATPQALHQQAVPLAFTSDGTSLIAKGSTGFESINLSDNTVTPIDGGPNASTYTSMKGSPDGAYFVFSAKDGTAAVYALSGTHLSLLGNIQGAAQIVFSPNGRFMALDSGGTHAQIYSTWGNTLQLVGLYTLPLAQNTLLLGWYH